MTDTPTAGRENAPAPAPRPRLARRVAGALPRHPFRLISALCVLGAGLYAAANPAWTSHQVALSFGPRPVNYSELFFSDAKQVTTRLNPDVNNFIRFDIVNREGHTYQYTYVVTLTGPGAHGTAEKKDITLKNNSRAVLIANFEPTKQHAQYTVTITINVPFDFIEFHGRTA
jgi:hypothetical protein